MNKRYGFIFFLTCFIVGQGLSHATCMVSSQGALLPSVIVKLYRNTPRGIAMREADLAFTYEKTRKLILLCLGQNVSNRQGPLEAFHNHMRRSESST